MSFTVKIFKWEENKTQALQVVVSCDACRLNVFLQEHNPVIDLIQYIQTHVCPTGIVTLESKPRSYVWWPSGKPTDQK